MPRFLYSYTHLACDFHRAGTHDFSFPFPRRPPHGILFQAPDHPRVRPPVNASVISTPTPDTSLQSATPALKPLRNLVQLGFWAPGMAFVRRCRDAGVAVHLLHVTDEQPHPGRICSALASASESLPWNQIGSEAGLARIAAFARSVDADAIATIDEFSLLWLARNRHIFEPRCRLLASPAASIERLLEKSEQTTLARQAGFQLLESWLLHTPADAGLIRAAAFPICLRPTYINSVDPPFKARRINSPQQLRDFVADTTWRDHPLLAQPFRFGPNIVLHGVRTPSGEFLALQGFRAYRKFSGFALSLEPCDLPRSVMDAARRFAALAAIDGPFHFDLLEADGEIYFLEVNFRMGGTTAKVVRLGYDEPLLALAAYGLQPPLAPPPLPAARRVTGKRMLAAQMLSALRRPAGDMDFPQRSRLWTLSTALWEMLTVPDALLSRRDIPGSLWYLRRGGRM